ncbi:MAG TPA: PAS domain S-box protein [Candidatus Methylacidiphilales bacterium]|nr:PAS domain S-box protein [Candidatus Methylacidiphilales bacterium]
MKTRKKTAPLARTAKEPAPDVSPDETIRQWAALFDQVNDAIIAKTVDGRITAWNPAAERMFGYSAAEIIGRSSNVLFPSDRIKEADEAVARANQGERVQPLETICLRKDGRQLEVSIAVTPLRSKTGQIIGASKILRDVTEYNRVKHQIEEQKALLDRTQDAILIFEPEGRILYWNKGAERIYGWSATEAAGRFIGEFIHSDIHKFRDVNRLVMDTGEWTGEMHHLNRERHELIMESRWWLVRDKDGRPKSILAINTDVTEKRRIEVQFMRAQRMESLGILAGGIAHDLNNILTPIMLSIDVLKSMTVDSHQKSILETIELSARRGSDIVQQVLSFARGMEGQRIVIQPKYLLKDIEHIVNDTFPKDIRLELILPHDTWSILGDPTQVQQVLLNLCVNARDAMVNGGTLTIKTENCMADEHYVAMNHQAKLGSYVAISVTDVGMGMPPDILDSIFEPFFTTKELGKGTGLGLSSVKAIVKNHGGFINVYSEIGRGSTFKVYLPAQTAPSEAPQQRGSKDDELPRGAGETILVVDDEASILTITSETLQAFGYNVVTANNGAEAVAIYAQQKESISAILTDLSMPVMDGRATIYAMLKINPKAKIIAMSGMDESESVAKASVAGIKHFISKPYTAATLLKALRALQEA